MSISYERLGPTALLCNIVVVSGGSYIFFREGLLDLKKSWPFLLFSVPFAFLGGYLPIKEKTFFLLLAISLIAAAILLWFQNSFQKKSESPSRLSSNFLIKIGLGGFIGLLSGMVRIGGGIFLSPVLHLMNWDEARRISALASIFILVNSISGLAGQLTRQSNLDWKFIAPLLAAVLIGGQLGSRLGAKWFNAIYIKRITAVLILLVGINILNNYW